MTRLIGKITVWRVIFAAIMISGLYATYLKKAIGYLQHARDYAEPAQATVIDDLIRFYRTGDPKDWLTFGADWVRNDAAVDFANGFIEVYRDPRGARKTACGQALRARAIGIAECTPKGRAS